MIPATKKKITLKLHKGRFYLGLCFEVVALIFYLIDNLKYQEIHEVWIITSFVVGAVLVFSSYSSLLSDQDEAEPFVIRIKEDETDGAK